MQLSDAAGLLRRMGAKGVSIRRKASGVSGPGVYFKVPRVSAPGTLDIYRMVPLGSAFVVQKGVPTRGARGGWYQNWEVVNGRLHTLDDLNKMVNDLLRVPGATSS